MVMFPSEVFSAAKTALEVQFNQDVSWLQQVSAGDGEPETNTYGEKTYEPVQYIRGRAVTVFRESFGPQGFQRLQATSWKLPAHTGVRAGDQLYGVGDDPKRYPPIESVKQVPDPVSSLFEVATTGFV